MLDTILHTIMGAVLALIFGALLWGLMGWQPGVPFAAAVFGAFAVWWRELVQAQVLPTGKSDFLTGWAFWREWGRQKNLETWAPVGALLVAGAALALAAR